MGWYNDDDLWQRFYECMFDDESFKLAESQSQLLLSLVNHPVKNILDLGCGPGRHCLALSKLGFDVTGIDSSPYLLTRAKQKAEAMQVSVPFIQADMLVYIVSKPVDLIINMFNSFGYFDSQEKNQALVNRSYQNLSEHGTFIIDTVGKETLARNIEPVHLSEYNNGDLRIERPLLIDNMQIFSNEWILVQGDQVFRRSYQHYVYTPMELSAMCYKAGFKRVSIFGSLDGDEYDMDSERLVIVAEKF